MYPCRLLASLEYLADQVPIEAQGSSLILRNTFGVALYSINPNAFSGHSFSISLGNGFNFQRVMAENIIQGIVPSATSSISIPGTPFMISNTTSEARIVHSVFLNEALFLRREEYIRNYRLENNKLASIIVGVQADNVIEFALEEPVQVTFLKHPVSNPLVSDYHILQSNMHYFCTLCISLSGCQKCGQCILFFMGPVTG